MNELFTMLLLSSLVHNIPFQSIPFLPHLARVNLGIALNHTLPPLHAVLFLQADGHLLAILWRRQWTAIMNPSVVDDKVGTFMYALATHPMSRRSHRP